MGKRKSKDIDDESIRKKIRRLEEQIRKRQRSRIRVLESSSSDEEDYIAIDWSTTDDEPLRSQHSSAGARASRASSSRPGPSRGASLPKTAQPRPPLRSASPVAGPSSAPDPPPRAPSPVAGPSSAPDPPPRAPSPVAGPSSAPDPPPRPNSPVAGPSSVPDQIPVQIDVDTPSAEDLELDEEILKLLGDAPKQDTALGNPIHKDIASRWREILLKGLQKEVKDKLLEEYLIPSNCDLLIAPVLNPEAKAALPEALVKRDSAIMYKQKQIGLALAALAQAAELVIKTGSSSQEILKPISDASRILCDSHFTETKTRRNFVISSINTGLKDTLINTERDKFLFGDNVSDKLKNAQTIQKSGNTLKNTPKSSYNPFNKSNFTLKHRFQKGNLNFKALHRKPSYHGSGSRFDAGRARPAATATPARCASPPRRAADRARSPPRRAYRK